MRTNYVVEAQIKSIQKSIDEGKCKNKWAAVGLIKKLNKELANLNTKNEKELINGSR